MFKFHSKEEALAALPTRQYTWDRRSPNYKKPTRLRKGCNRVLFERVPPSLRWLAQKNFDELVATWHRNHPFMRMTQGKRASLIANATRYALYAANRKWQSRMNNNRQYRKDALRYLQSLELQEFKAQPIFKRVKRLI